MTGVSALPASRRSQLGGGWQPSPASTQLRHHWWLEIRATTPASPPTKRRTSGASRREPAKVRDLSLRATRDDLLRRLPARSAHAACAIAAASDRCVRSRRRCCCTWLSIPTGWHDEPLRAAWPGTVVSQTVLWVCIREIRAALGEDADS
jgi:hypothetical protein